MAEIFAKKRMAIQVCIEVCCDICGVSATSDIAVHNDPRADMFALRHSFGYGTEHDGTTVRANICEPCLHTLISTHIPGAVFS